MDVTLTSKAYLNIVANKEYSFTATVFSNVSGLLQKDGSGLFEAESGNQDYSISFCVDTAEKLNTCCQILLNITPYCLVPLAVGRLLHLICKGHVWQEGL